MSFGIRVVNDLGEGVIDDRTVSYTLRYSGEYTANVLVSGTIYTLTTVSYAVAITTTEPPLVAAYWTDGNVFIATIVHQGVAGAWSGFQLWLTQENQSLPTTLVKYKVFTGPQSGIDDSWGLRVYTADGGVVFDTSKPVLSLTSFLDQVDWVYQGYVWQLGGTAIHSYLMNNPSPGSYYLINSLMGVGMGSPHGGAPKRFTVRYGSTAAGSIKMRIYEIGEPSPGQPATVVPEIYKSVLCR